MKKSFAYICLMLLGISVIKAQQVTSLTQIKANKKYILENAYGYGYAVYNPDISDYYVELGGASVIHSMGCKNELYKTEVNPLDANNQWKITAGEKGTWYLYNLGARKYLTDATTTYGWGGWTFTNYADFFFTDEKTEVDIIEQDEGIWAFRLTGAAGDGNAHQKYMCAASHSDRPMAAWEASDIGSMWYIKEVVEELAQSIKLSQSTLTMTEGTVFALTATVLPSTAPGANMIEWSSDNEYVATVEDGKVRAIKPGTCTITVTVKDGSNLSATCAVTVNESTDKDNEDLGTLHYFTLTDGQLVVIPEKYIENRTNADGKTTITLTGDTTFVYVNDLLASEETVYNGDLPVFESFKFNNKFNDQLYTDADGIIDNDKNTINLSVSCIGKNLTPSFKVPEGAHAYVDGKEQHSKVTRRRFDSNVIYTLAYPKSWIYRVRKISDAVWSTPPEENEEPWILTPVNLTANMLSSNWPSANSDQKIEYVLDGNVETYFHSNWSASNNWSEESYYGDGVTTWPYLQIDLPESLENLQLNYTTRNWEQNNGYAPQRLIIQCSNDGENWDEVATLDKEKDNLPIGAAKQFSSAVILLGKPYKHLRLQLAESTRKNYLVLSELSINKATPNPNYGKSAEDFEPEIIVPAVYEQGFVPFGRDYTVQVNYLTDHPTSEYGVPRIDITFGDGQTWSYDNWIGRYGKETWEEATISINGAGVFPNMEETPISIRGRGNSSWSQSWSAKNPYRIKFPEKMKPFGLTKGKNWVLLANKQSGSLTTNAIAMKVADMVESAGCNHIIPVELYVNNQYRGQYNFTEKVGFANNSISLDDESNATMLELDSYYDESYKFYSNKYSEPVNVKSPDFTNPEEITNLTYTDVKNAFNLFDEAVYSGKFSAMLDVDAFCRAMLVTDLVRNTEVQHPKSWYVYNKNILADSAWVFGPVWDFDWSYGYEGHNQYFIYDAESDLFNYGNKGIPFFRTLLRNSEVVKKHYYKVWTEFLNAGKLDELIDFCDDYYVYAKPSFVHNNSMWGDGRQYETVTEKAKTWLTKRANYVYSHLTPYDLSEDIIEMPEDFDYGQPDRIDISTITQEPVDVYTLKGIRIRSRVPYINCTTGLMPGIYIVKGKKVIIK